MDEVAPPSAHAGEFCHLDRALVFQDPDGTRILYYPGQGEGGECAKPEFPNGTLPTTNAVAIAVAKGAKMVTGSEMPKFFGSRIKVAEGEMVEGTRLDVFLKAVQVPAHVPLSSRTVTFDGDADCVSGC